jgi:hypothetical protein
MEISENIHNGCHAVQEQSNYDEMNYLNQIKQIMDNGVVRSDRTGTGSICLKKPYAVRKGRCHCWKHWDRDLYLIKTPLVSTICILFFKGPFQSSVCRHVINYSKVW